MHRDLQHPDATFSIHVGSGIAASSSVTHAHNSPCAIHPILSALNDGSSHDVALLLLPEFVFRNHEANLQAGTTVTLSYRLYVPDPSYWVRASVRGTPSRIHEVNTFLRLFCE